MNIFIYFCTFTQTKKSGASYESEYLGSHLYLLKSFTPTLAKTSSSMKKFPVVFLWQLVIMTWAESAIMSVFLDACIIESPPSTFWTAAVAIEVLGHKALTAIYPLNSSLIPNTHILIPYLAIV